MESLENTVIVEEENLSENQFTQNDETITDINDNIKDTADPADYVKKDDEEENKDSEEKESDEASSEDENEDKKEAKKYEILETEFNALKDAYSALQHQYQELLNFKNEIDNQKKDELIAEFYMLSNEDKEDVISNKDKYTLEEIKAKLSVICFDKKINFNLNNEVEKENEDIITYTLDNENNSLPDWVKAVKEQEKELV